jgi:hypothetical protein
MWSGFIWLRIVASSGLSWSWQWSFGLHTIRYNDGKHNTDYSERYILGLNTVYSDTSSSTQLRNVGKLNIVTSAECECGDGLQTEEHIFWDCKLYEDQKETMTDILSENREKEYPKSITELSRFFFF